MKGVIISTATWNGSVDNSWDTAANWTPAEIPNQYSNVVIPRGLTNYPTTSSDITINALEIESGATFITQNTVNTGDDKVSFKRELSTNNWYLVSSPLANDTYQNLISRTNFATGSVDNTNIGLAFYDNTKVNASERWVYQKSDLSGTIDNAKGMSVKLTNAGETIEFKGDINSSNITKAITTGAANSYNLIGNPFTGYLNSQSFLDSNTNELQSKTIWLWDQSKNSYTTKVAIENFKVAPGQGFFVKASSTPISGNITFDVSSQSHQSENSFLKSEQFKLDIQISNSNLNKDVIIYYLDDATLGFDNGSDGELFGGYTSDLEIYTTLLSNTDNKKYQIQSLPKSNYEAMVIPLGIITKDNSELTFSLAHKNLPDGLNVFLEDKVENTVTLLENDATYKFIPSINNNEKGRFFIHTTSKSLSTTNDLLNNVNLYKLNNSLIISGIKNKAKLYFYSILGEEKFIKTVNEETQNIGLPTLAKGIYIAKVVTNTGSFTKKIVID